MPKTLIVGTRGGSNEYRQSMFWSKNKKNMYTPANPSFTLIKLLYFIKVGCKGVFVTRTCFRDELIWSQSCQNCKNKFFDTCMYIFFAKFVRSLEDAMLLEGNQGVRTSVVRVHIH